MSCNIDLIRETSSSPLSSFPARYNQNLTDIESALECISANAGGDITKAEVADISAYLDNKIDNVQDQVTELQLEIANLACFDLQIANVLSGGTTLDFIPISAGDIFEWDVMAISEANTADRQFAKVKAIHDDENSADYNMFSVLETGSPPELDVQVLNDGTYIILTGTCSKISTVLVERITCKKTVIGASGTFTTNDGKTVVVSNGLITSIL